MGIAFQQIVIVMLENSLRADVMANPYMDRLRKKGVFLSNSQGVTHSSQPNYIVSVAGDSFGLYNDTPGYVQWIYDNHGIYSKHPVTCIVDLLEERGFSWRAYAEDLPDGYVDAAAQEFLTAQENYLKSKPTQPPTPAQLPVIPPDPDPFARKHVPFLSFPNVITKAHRRANIVNADQFEKDIQNGKLPKYSWYTPNLINDGHNAPTGGKGKDGDAAARIQNIANFLERFLSDDPISKFPPETLIVITFDEAYPYHDPYEIYTLLIGDMLQAGTTNTQPCNHYSLLRSVEVNFGLGSFRRNDTSARPYWFLRE